MGTKALITADSFLWRRQKSVKFAATERCETLNALVGNP